MKLTRAVNAHTDWKIRLRWAITERAAIDADEVAGARGCELGRWLEGDLARQFGSHPLYDACVRAHEAFHRECARVADLINAGRYDEAQRMLEPGSAYHLASHEVVFAIAELKRETSQSGFWKDVE
jgi:hypothetical protein